MINILIYMILLSVCAYLSFLFGSETMLLLAAGGLLFFLFALAYLAVQIWAVMAGIHIPVSMTECGEKAELRIHLKNRFIFPVNRMKIYIECRNSLTGKRKRGIIGCTVDGRKQLQLSEDLSKNHCGMQLIKIKKIKIYDLTGMFYMTKRGKKQAELIVMPRIYPVLVRITERSGHFMGEAEIYDETAAGPDLSEPFFVRPFREGDRIRNIHWKLTARTDELTVREGSLPLGCPVVLFLDFVSTGSRSAETDAALSLAASVSCALTAGNCMHYIAWYSLKTQDIERLPVFDEEQLYMFLLAFYEDAKAAKPLSFLRKKAAGPYTDLRTAYSEKYRTETVVTEIMINGKLQVTCGGVPLGKMSADHLEEELGEVEFIV